MLLALCGVLRLGWGKKWVPCLTYLFFVLCKGLPDGPAAVCCIDMDAVSTFIECDGTYRRDQVESGPRNDLARRHSVLLRKTTEEDEEEDESDGAGVGDRTDDGTHSSEGSEGATAEDDDDAEGEEEEVETGDDDGARADPGEGGGTYEGGDGEDDPPTDLMDEEDDAAGVRLETIAPLHQLTKRPAADNDSSFSADATPARRDGQWPMPSLVSMNATMSPLSATHSPPREQPVGNPLSLPTDDGEIVRVGRGSRSWSPANMSNRGSVDESAAMRLASTGSNRAGRKGSSFGQSGTYSPQTSVRMPPTEAREMPASPARAGSGGVDRAAGLTSPKPSNKRPSVAFMAVFDPMSTSEKHSMGSSGNPAVTVPPAAASSPAEAEPPTCWSTFAKTIADAKKLPLRFLGSVVSFVDGDQKLQNILLGKANLELASDGRFARFADIFVLVAMGWSYVDFTMSIIDKRHVNTPFRIGVRGAISFVFLVDWIMLMLFAERRFAVPRRILEAIGAVPWEAILAVTAVRDDYAANIALCALRLPKFIRLGYMFESSHPERIDEMYVTFFYQALPLLLTLARVAMTLHTLAVIKMLISVGDAAQYWMSMLYVWTACLGNDTNIFIQVENFLPQAIFLSILGLVGVVMNGFVVGYVSLFVFTFSVKEQNRQQIIATRELTKHYRLPTQLQQEVLSVQHNILENAGTTQSFGNVLDTLPPSMLKHIARYVRLDVLSRFALIQSAETQIVLELADALERETFVPDQVIIKAGDIGMTMYFMDHGFAEVMLPTGLVVAHLRKGDFFGEVALLSEDSRRKATITSLTYCQCYVLHRDAFVQAVNKSDGLLMAVQEKRRVMNIAGPINLNCSRIMEAPPHLPTADIARADQMEDLITAILERLQRKEDKTEVLGRRGTRGRRSGFDFANNL